MLITTDIAARGLDIPDLAWVFHYDLPTSSQAFVHRCGRTGRRGQAGTSVVLIDQAQLGMLSRLGKELKLEFSPLPERKPGSKKKS